MRRQVGMLMLVMGIVGCGGGDGGGGVERPFQPSQETGLWTYNQTRYDGTPMTFTSEWVGEVEVNGRTFKRLQAGSFRSTPAAPEGVEIWADWQPDHITFGGGEVHHVVPGVNVAGVPLLSGAPDAPIEIDLDPPVGEPQTFQVTGTAHLGDPADPASAYPVDATVTYTMVERDVTVETSIGDIAGCRHFQGSTTAYEMTFEGDAWYHPELGMVAGHINWPAPNGTTLDLLGIQDYGSPDADTGDIQAVAMVGPGTPPFSLNTYDVNQLNDADKDRHAKMLLEVRWADEDKARTDTPPAVSTEFGTIFGVFPHHLVPSPVSIFHPEENGLGYTFWVALVDEAAKNEPMNGISYHISVQATDFASSAARVTARIVYKKAP